ncbi:protrudin isoform X3 [Carassius auratus]|uniref:Protrudin n=1 Tax=Carassius auratus TaxID=7957 RepID=A0A6P6L522_CARAU|nr:protrudin isoform X3 [Carassius auratus]
MQCAASHPQDPSQASGDRAELTQLPSTDSTSDLGSPRALTFDLLNMVISFKRMAIFLEPVTDSLEVLRYLLGWRMPLCSLFSCVLLNILFLTLSEGAWVALLLLVVSTPAALGYLGNRCQGTSCEVTVQKKQHFAVQRRELKMVHMSKQEAMLEVKDMLKRIDDLLTLACVYAESVYKVLYWESHAMSSMFYGSLLTALCLLYLVPVGLSLSVLNSALFLWNRNFYRVLLELKEGVHPSRVRPVQETEPCDPDQASLLESTPTPTSVESQSPGNIEEAEEAEPDDEFKDAIEESQLILPETPLALVDDEEVSSGVPEFDTVSDNGLLSRNEPIRSKVSKLTEKLRKRVPANATGNCFHCSSAFSVLKKRRNCSNCGVSFCSRCCSYKVLRSSMGATAPEAQRETVFVCSMCNTFLSTK